jgi:molybdopterin-guanine dinucleotide biosynthesis protein A
MNVHVLIPAAGSGSRIGGETRKQYLELGDRPILVQTLSRLSDQPQISSIHLVVPEEDVATCRADLVESYRLEKIGVVIAGGAERQDRIRLKRCLTGWYVQPWIEACSGRCRPHRRFAVTGFVKRTGELMLAATSALMMHPWLNGAAGRLLFFPVINTISR